MTTLHRTEVALKRGKPTSVEEGWTTVVNYPYLSKFKCVCVEVISHSFVELFRCLVSVHESLIGWLVSKKVGIHTPLVY